jgi:hypothetical protein
MKRTSLLRGNNARAYMNYLKAIGIPFEMICSNYTTVFKAEGLEKKFVASMQSNRAFACFAKLKSDLKSKPMPTVEMDKLSYFIHDFKQDEYIGDVINIDLKSAYATVLLKDGFIKQETFDYICKGTKQERLTSVGMLASKKQHFKFDGGHITGVPEEVISPFANYFFYCVRRTGEIMGELKSICGNDYLFTWVDGIYLRPNIAAMQECERYIESIGHKYSTEWLREFKITIGAKKVNVDFLKFSKGEWKPKPFNLPLANNDFKMLIAEAIISRKIKTTK